MKSIQTKILTVVISVILIIAMTTTLISFLCTRRILENDSDIITESVANTESLKINSYLRDIEYTVNSMRNYVLSTVRTPEDILDKTVRDAYSDTAQDPFMAIVNNFNGILAFYLRFSPDLYDNTSGFLMSKTLDDASLHEIAPTDLTNWENDKYENVCWFTEPKRTGKPTWILPYTNVENQTSVISYVIPIYINANFIGVAGVDVEFSKVTDMVSEISVYDNGFAYLSDSTEETVYFSPVSDHQLDKTYTDHGFAEEHKTLTNGMTLVIHADYNDIQRDSYRMTIMIVIAVVLFLIIFILITWILTKRIVSPLKKLTSAAEVLADGNVEINLDDCKTKDEVGILAAAIEKASEKLHGYMKYINSLAYKDALTGIKNRTAYNEASTEMDVQIKIGECESFAIMVADVNGLKETNDKYGHEIGNKLLVKSAKTICDVFKHSPVYRIGGDEFVVILRGEDLENHVALMQTLDEKFERTFITVGDTKIKVSVARATADYDSDLDVSFEDVFNRADKRMYEHKSIIKAAR